MSRLGAGVARHALVTIAAVGAVGMYLSIRVLFLHQPTLSSKHAWLSPLGHAWTSLHPVRPGRDLIPDILIKQLFIYGGWMEAMERDTILEAAAIQEALLVPMSNWATATWSNADGGSPIEHIVSGSLEPDAPDAFVHSPLLYWNGPSALGSTDSILSVVNSRTGTKSPANITLAPLSVLSRPVWSGGVLVAADALVVSLVYKTGSCAGEKWDEHAETLTQTSEGRWEVFSQDTGKYRSKLFKFQSYPVSVQDKVTFIIIFVLVALLVISSLKHLKPLRGKIGLLIAMAIQGCLSVCCSFTVASSLHLDIASVPLEAYLLIVLVGALDNISRLVHEIERSPPVNRPVRRVSMALGSVGHILLIAVARNAFVLFILSYLLTPGLASACYFVALSLVVDMLFFWSFFVAVLTVDLQLHSVQDSLENAARPCQSTETNQQSATYGLALQPQSGTAWRPWHVIIHYPRILGSVASLVFIVLLVWHFPYGEILLNFGQGFTTSLGLRGFQRHDPVQYIPGLGRMADSEDCLHNQDLHTMNEILRLVRPGSTCFVARIYNPLVVVLKSANRHISPEQRVLQPPLIDNYTSIQFGLFVVMLCSLTIVVVSNYFSYPVQDEEDSHLQNSGTVSSVYYLPHGHSLDVYLLSASRNSYLASVGFDHEIRYWDLGPKNTSDPILTFSGLHGLWPVAAIVIDDKGEWLAICSKQGDIRVWNIRQQTGQTIAVGLNARTVLCSFMPDSIRDSRLLAPLLFIVGTNGILMDIEVETRNVTTHQICTKQIQSSYLYSNRPGHLRLISITDNDEIYITTKREGCWTSRPLYITLALLQQPAHLRFTTIPGLRMIGLAFDIDTSQLYLIDFLSAAPIYVFHPRPFKHDTLRAIHSYPQQCLSCGAVALASLSIVYTETHDNRLTMHTLSAKPNPFKTAGLTCLRAERDVRERRCMGFHSSIEHPHSMPHAGVWEATAANGVAGIRRAMPCAKVVASSIGDGMIFRRGQMKAKKEPETDEEGWEAWTMTARGVVNIHPLRIDVFTHKVGPIKPVGRNAIAVGIAEEIVLVQFGNRVNDNNDNDDDSMGKRRTPHARLAGRSKSG